jgi:hypothetical protein
MFPVYCGKCLSRKAVHNGFDKFSQGRSKVADDARPGAEVTETTVKRLVCCGFRRTDKATGQVYQCWSRICREINVLSRFEYCTFYVLYPFAIYLLTLPHIHKLFSRFGGSDIQIVPPIILSKLDCTFYFGGVH